MLHHAKWFTQMKRVGLSFTIGHHVLVYAFCCRAILLCRRRRLFQHPREFNLFILISYLSLSQPPRFLMTLEQRKRVHRSPKKGIAKVVKKKAPKPTEYIEVIGGYQIQTF